MKRGYVLFVALAAATLLAGCVPPAQQRQTAQAAPAATSQQAKPDAPVPQAKPAAPAAQATQQVRVDFHLAQTAQAKGLKELKLPKGTLWYLPEPVLTRADLADVQSLHTQKNQALVRFTFTKQGAGKLASITNRYKGKFLVLTVHGSLARILQIQGPINNGILNVPYPSQKQANTLVNVIAGK